ncbi:MAG: N-acetyl-gamma-glutamyl-phosphate reductase, partial [Nevskia sp.]|nr:N-acetyl-gamma-glutamyl-phosphate reductase [Nevskia sp.]
TGYTGAELLRLLARHPSARVKVLTSRQEAGKRADALFPQLRGYCDVSYTAPDAAALAGCHAVFFATPHGTAMSMAPELVAKGIKVIDLSADFRLKDPAVYKQWYKQDHACPELLAEAVYGLPEIHRNDIRRARVIGNPGCYPTAVSLGLLPLLEAEVVDRGALIADCKSGVSGAGRELKLGSMFVEASDNLKSYGVAGHRHLPEIVQELSAVAGAPVGLTFIPHLIPMIRGMQATIYARLSRPDVNLQALFESRYRGEPFVDVLPAGAEPETRSVRASNTCRLAVHRPGGGDTVVVLSVIDNLVKGAAGQALQCFNLMFDCDEQTGLDAPPLSP